MICFAANRLCSLFSMLIAVGDPVFIIISIIGIVNAAVGKAKELSLIGRFRILK